ncbi:MAG: response regulator transcription factor [Flavobacteriaceae bacterium]
MSIRCVIIDDEPLAIEVLETHLMKVPEITIVAVFRDSLKAFNYIKEEKIDLLFLDIEMPLLTGIDLIKAVDDPPKVIFTTAYRNYAVASYELDIDVVDYLLKPISFTRIFKAINKYKNLAQISTVTEFPIEQEIKNDHIYVNSNKKFIKISFDEISYVESIKDYVRIHLADKNVVTKDSIGNFINKLPSQFLRIHRSFIVNTTKVSAFTSLDVEIGTKEIPIGASYKNDVIHFFKK